ncbi:hypothetical protein PMAYCL1PPCAC_31316, partial [Pristionchus mayeri]
STVQYVDASTLYCLLKYRFATIPLNSSVCTNSSPTNSYLYSSSFCSASGSVGMCFSYSASSRRVKQTLWLDPSSPSPMNS